MGAYPSLIQRFSNGCWYPSLNLATGAAPVAESVANFLLSLKPLLNFSDAIFSDRELSVTKSVANILATEFFVAKILIFCSV